MNIKKVSSAENYPILLSRATEIVKDKINAYKSSNQGAQPSDATIGQWFINAFATATIETKSSWSNIFSNSDKISFIKAQLSWAGIFAIEGTDKPNIFKVILNIKGKPVAREMTKEQIELLLEGNDPVLGVTDNSFGGYTQQGNPGKERY